MKKKTQNHHRKNIHKEGERGIIMEINYVEEIKDNEEINYTKNGEITWNKTTGEFKVYNETYTDVICTTQYLKIAEIALKIYAEDFLG